MQAGLQLFAKRLLTVLALAIAAAWSVVPWTAQQHGPQRVESAPAGTIPVSMVVTVEAKRGKQIPVVYREDVRVFQGSERLQVKDWVSLAQSPSKLELYLLIDDSVTTSLGLQLEDLRKFITAQPSTSAIAVGYVRNASVQMVQEPTHDHALAAKALRLPLGITGGMASPYLALSDLTKNWPASTAWRQILLISSGIDALQPGPNNTYLEQAIEHAQRAGVQISSIYASPVGHKAHTTWLMTWGQNDLSQLAEETGGEAYFQALSMPIAFAPYLNQFADRLKHQYLLTFYAKPGKSGFERIRLETEVPDAELVAQDRVYVPAAK